MLDSSEMWEFTFVCSSNKSKRLFSPRASTSPVKSRLPPAAYVIFARVRVVCWYVVSNQRGTVCRACVRMCVRACVRARLRQRKHGRRRASTCLPRLSQVFSCLAFPPSWFPPTRTRTHTHTHTHTHTTWDHEQNSFLCNPFCSAV